MLSRRNLLKAFAGTMLAPALPRLALAAAPGDYRFVCIVLRGAMDGLDVLRPVGDKSFTGIRPAAAAEANIPLDGFYAMHPGLKAWDSLYRARELAFAQAVATPYRSRSHFEGQDVLEQGGDSMGLHGGWLNRALAEIPGAHAIDIGPAPSLLLSGTVPVEEWSPHVHANLTADSLQFLQALYAGDPLLSHALSGITAEEGAGPMKAAERDTIGPEMAKLAASFLLRDARIAAFSIIGWDTHTRQQPRLAALLPELADTIVALKEALGPTWAKTVVMMCSEFGRTVHINGTGGTDHGTGGLAIMAGGLLRNGSGGKVLGNWPGLSNLYEGRDLQPTSDVRAYLGSTLSSMFGLPLARISDQVFPSLELRQALPII